MTDFLVYSRGTSAAAEAADDPALDERHWSYMDRFADRMTARGPTLGRDRQTWTGSLHIVDLAGADAARDFVADEPYNQAGAYDEHHVWRFTNLLGRTMWQFDGPPAGPRFLVVAQVAQVAQVAREGSSDWRPSAIDDLPAALRTGLVVYGELRTVADEPAGVVLAVQVPSRDALDGLLADPRTGLDDLALDVHDWEFGGRR